LRSEFVDEPSVPWARPNPYPRSVASASAVAAAPAANPASLVSAQLVSAQEETQLRVLEYDCLRSSPTVIPPVVTVIGSVRNTAGAPLWDIQAVAYFLDTDGEVIGSDAAVIPATMTGLAPGAIAGFRVEMAERDLLHEWREWLGRSVWAPRQMATCRLDFWDFHGNPVSREWPARP
jgi:hypothetical protein